MTPVGSGLATDADPAVAAFAPQKGGSAQSLFVESGATIYTAAARLEGRRHRDGQYRDQRPGHLGQQHIPLARSANLEYQGGWGIKNTGTSTDQLTSTSTYQGQGNIARSEQIQVSVAAIVTAVLPNGNLLHQRIAGGSRELRIAPVDASRASSARRHQPEQYDPL